VTFLGTDKNENKILLIYKEILMGSGEKSYIWKGFLIYEDMRKCTKKIFSPYMRRSLVIYSMTLHTISLNFLIYEKNVIFFFISVSATQIYSQYIG
jgi:hypothetical protein